MGWSGKPLNVPEAITIIMEKELTTSVPLNLDANVDKGSPTNGPPVLEVRNLHYTYPDVDIEALQGINLKIYPGEFVAILGKNGSGKTTLAKHFNGLLHATQGEVLINDRPLGTYLRREVAQMVGYVFQNPDHQLFSNTVRDEVSFSLKIFGYDSETIGKRVDEALEAVGLTGFEEEIPFTLTKGERQRVAVASVLATQPEVIILDEPTTGLDYLHQRGMMSMLQDLHRAGHTIIIITHSMWVASEYGQRTVVMGEGRVLLDGPTRVVFTQEREISQAGLHPPALLQLGNWLGTKALHLDQMVAELKAR
jgi:energy-coupling factor transport system ATP-binding protein